MIYNDSYAEFFDDQGEPLLGRDIRDVWPLNRDFLDNIIATALAGITFDIEDQEFRIVGELGTELVWATLDVMPIFDTTGTPRGCTMIIRDETEKMLAILGERG